MKKLFIILICLLMSINYTIGQITVDHVYTTDAPQFAVKLSSGLKYYSVHAVSVSPSFTILYFILYNPDHSFYRTINVPQISGKNANSVYFVSDVLFDLDTLIEYMVIYLDLATYVKSLAILNESGNALLNVDSVDYPVSSPSAGAYGFVGGPIFPNGNQTKLYLYTDWGDSNTTTVYNLPGQLACVECVGGLVSGLAQPPGLPSEDVKSLAYPNPAADYIKIKYSLPPHFHRAFVNLYDITGKLITQKEIDGQYDDIYLSTEEIRQGAYSYEIVVDNKRMSSGKIIKL